MQINVHFYSFFRELCEAQTSFQTELPAESTIENLLQVIFARYPKIAPMEKSMLIAVGVDYQPRNHRLQDGDEVSLFPPVQGG